MSSEEMEGEVSILLIITVVIGSILMSSLLACYICVFRQLCCAPDINSHHHRNGTYQSSKRTYNSLRRESVNMGELTHVSSQPTETERV
ncbi:uncharacterized protein LOC129612051 [Condylostylus longicornis]|uniref:uncharacterized protein LOC129612051 n=1 Tax=Condylostylus longicornis TaxID=2530218 RepID=UPI00244E4909|nr:uncharacterized protein LOC129612051 [Condylostylus longicornis]